MPLQFKRFNSRKVTSIVVTLLILVSGVSANATGVFNTPSNGYLVCVNAKTKVVTHPGTSSCPKGSKSLLLGAQGIPGLTGATGLPGINGKDGRDGKDGKTLWNGVKDPESIWGAPGDMYINSVTKTLFGPKSVDGVWPLGVSMVGPKGDQGPIGLTGPMGPQGPGGSGPQGPAGATGASSLKITEQSICGAGGMSLCKVGSIGPGGGWIFFVDYYDQYSGFNYLEAAPSSCEARRAWSSARSSVSAVEGWAGRAVGAGLTNTAAIKAVFTSDNSTNNAAYFASACSAGSKSDWFLGSLSEIKLMYDNLQGVGGFVEDVYWSSSGRNANDAWGQYFIDGGQRYNNTGNLYYVRPVRAF